MELNAIKALLELTGGPSFALENGSICCADPKATALGLTPGASLSLLLPDLSPLQTAADGTAEIPLFLAGRNWNLRIVAAGEITLCFLRSPHNIAPAPNESTLLHTAGSIRLALQDFLVALDSMADRLCDKPETAQQAALALRSVYRLRRTAGDLELLASLCAGTFRRVCRPCLPVAAAAELCAELAELLRPAGCTLRWELPKREFPCCLDWPLTAALLRELIANAAANTLDGQIHLTLTKIGKNRLCFMVRNTPSTPLPESSFHRHAAEQSDPLGGAGLGLSLVSAGAECHGGGLILSQSGDGSVAALLTLTASDTEDETVRSPVQLPQDPDINLVALSPVLPTELYRPEDLL